MSAIDERASRGFAAAADNYAAYRPGYPRAVVEFIREAAGLDERSTVVDLAAGTGLMTRLLLPVSRLIAVEPVPEMRATLCAQVPEAEAMDGTAEEIPLPSAVADAVVVAQAFHWFANTRALSEIARILKPNGILVLVWNIKDARDRVMERLDEILAPYRLESPGFASTLWREVFDAEDSPLRLTSHETFSFEEPLTLDQLNGRVLSTSYIALLDDQAQRSVLAQLQRLAGAPADDAALVMKYHTEVFVARHR